MAPMWARGPTIRMMRSMMTFSFLHRTIYICKGCRLPIHAILGVCLGVTVNFHCSRLRAGTFREQYVSSQPIVRGSLIYTNNEVEHRYSCTYMSKPPRFTQTGSSKRVYMLPFHPTRLFHSALQELKSTTLPTHISLFFKRGVDI